MFFQKIYKLKNVNFSLGAIRFGDKYGLMWILGRGKFWVRNFRVKKFEKYKPVHILDLGHVLGQHIETLLDIFWIGLIDAPDAPTENQIRLTFFILKIKIIHTDKIYVPPLFPIGYRRGTVHFGRKAMGALNK